MHHGDTETPKRNRDFSRRVCALSPTRTRYRILFWSSLCLCVSVVEQPAARAQFLANQPINNLEMAPAGSMEWSILNRLATMHRYDPRDLFRLARMTVLESIAMYENTRADLPLTMMGAEREGELSRLWDAAELFYVAATPSDAPSLIRSRPLLADVEEAYARLSASLALIPGISPRASLHMQNLARLLPVMNALIDAMEADQGIMPVGVSPRPDPTAGLGWFREQFRGLVDSLRKVRADLRPGPDQKPILDDIDGLISQAEGLDGMLTDGSPSTDLVASLGLIRARLWPVEARTIQIAQGPAIAARWRAVRDQLNAILDRLGRPRVIAIQAARRPVAGVDRALLARADRAIAAVDELAATLDGAGARYREEVTQLRRRLLMFREQVAAREPVEALRRSSDEIADLHQRIAGRVRAEARVFRGDARRVDPRHFEAASKAVEQLLVRRPDPRRSPSSKGRR